MNSKSIIVLAGIVAALAVLLAIFEGSGERAERKLLLEGFAEHANDILRIQIRFPDDEGGITVRKDDDAWVVGSDFDYAADVGRLRALVTGLSEARIVEEKTSNPDNYPRLAVDDPESDGSGTKLSLAGEGFSYEVILGNSAGGNLRYARIPEDVTSYLVDRELDVPVSADDWLRRDLLDIPAERVRKVTISHADGETIVLEKAAEDDSNFSIADIPENRELSYETVGNGIAGALANLDFEQVRQAADLEVTTTTVFETWDGLTIEIRIAEEDDASWLEFAADGDDAGALGERLRGWRYRIADHKTNLLKRRWDDLLQPAS